MTEADARPDRGTMLERGLPTKVVVVDDYPDGRCVTSTILRREGFEVLTMTVNPEELTATVRALFRMRRAEAELRQGQEHYRRLVDSALEGVWTVDADARTTYMNRRMAEMLGYDLAEVLGRSIFEFFDAPVREDAEARFARWRRGESEVFEARFHRQDGSALWAIVSALAIMGDDGRFEGALALVTDMTQRQRAEAAEQESESLRGVAKLAFAAAHDINNPLSVITGQLHFLAKEQPDSPRVAAIEKAAWRIQAIVSQMLQSSADRPARQ